MMLITAAMELNLILNHLALDWYYFLLDIMVKYHWDWYFVNLYAVNDYTYLKLIPV